MAAKDILQVLYAPHKVFKKIVQNPGYMGPFLLLIVFILGQVGGYYLVATRSYVETTSPPTLPLSLQGDLWTENAAFWHTNEGVTVSNNTIDYINSTLATSSIEFAASDTNNVWMEINFNGSVNSGLDMFQNVFFRLKQVTPEAAPENVSFYLYSLSDSNFYYDLTNEFSNSRVNVWNNLTLPIGVNSEHWVSSSVSASWENITGFKLDFKWSSSSNAVLRIDQLFFKGPYKTMHELRGVEYLANITISAFSPFLFEWLLLTVLMYIMIKALKGSVIWRPLMVAVGFSLIVIVIQSIIMVGIYTALPDVYYPLEYWVGSQKESELAYHVISDTIAPVMLAAEIVQAATFVWTVVLGTFIVRAVTSDKKIAEQVSMGGPFPDVAANSVVKGFSWMKCLLVSGVSLFVTVIIMDFLRILGI